MMFFINGRLSQGLAQTSIGKICKFTEESSNKIREYSLMKERHLNISYKSMEKSL